MKVLTQSVGFLLLISSSLAGVLRSDNENKVINGDLWPERALPYLVSIAKDGEHFCGGFIYNNKTVITAASCVENKTLSSLRAVVNQYSLINQDKAEEQIPIFKVTIKDDYDNQTFANDIAIIQLSKELTLIPYYDTNKENPGPSCARYDEVLGGQQTVDDALFAGWGATEVGGYGSQKLHSGKVEITSNSLCDSHYNGTYQSSIMICGSNLENSNEQQTGPCKLDEGGPLVVFDRETQEPVVVGIYSRNLECDSTIPSVYTRLSVYYAWIYKVAGAEPGNCFANGPVTTVVPEGTTVASGETTAETTVQGATTEMWSLTETTKETTVEIAETEGTTPTSLSPLDLNGKNFVL